MLESRSTFKEMMPCTTPQQFWRTDQTTGEPPCPTPPGAEEIGDGLRYTFPPGTLRQFTWLSADFLLDGSHLGVFVLTLCEGETGPAFGYSFGLLNQCSARLRMPLETVNQNRWRYPREGAFLMPRCQGERVDLSKVDRMLLTVEHKSSLPLRWCMTPIQASAAEPSRLTRLVLPKGPLLDELGQSALHDWPQKTRSTAELADRLNSQLAQASGQRWPAGYSRWGGWTGKKFDASGYFRTHHDGQRWWLVDPEGWAFWSAGVDCVRPDIDSDIEGLEPALAWLPEQDGAYAAAHDMRDEVGSVMPHRMFNFLAANFIRVFGPDAWYARWAEITLGELRRIGFNSVANWSDWQVASQAGMPYVRPLPNTYERLPLVYRDFPDVFHPDFPAAAQAFAQPLAETAADPALIGYFLMNEPTWGFALETPASGMLFNTPDYSPFPGRLRASATPATLVGCRLGLPVTLGQVARTWTQPSPPLRKLTLISAVLVEKFWRSLLRLPESSNH
jgi:hypothetical protein